MASLWEISSAVDAPPSFCDMGNAIKTLIVQASGGGQRDEECILLSEEHSLVLTCCWVSLKVKENSTLKGRLITLVNAVLFLFSSGNRNLFRFSGGKDAQ